MADLTWQLQTSGSLEEIGDLARSISTSRWRDLPAQYEAIDISPFSPSGAIYFMDGFSDATVRLRGTNEEISLAFDDRNTAISASAPMLYDEPTVRDGIYVPVPPPLTPVAYYPDHTPDRYRNVTSLHLLQVVSMNMTSLDGLSSLLIGLPYAQRYEELFFSAGVLESGNRGAASYGVVQSLTSFTDPATEKIASTANGYPARSFFGIYHIIETPVGAFFNKRATQMELEPDRQGKLALALPPIPFIYRLLNGPIPLFDVNRPDGDPVADLISAMHGSHKEASYPTHEEWPYEGVTPRQAEEG